MDETTKNMVTAQLKSAKTTEALHAAIVSAMIAVVDCQWKTGGRVKLQGIVLAVVGTLLAIALLCGNETALKILSFWKGAV